MTKNGWIFHIYATYYNGSYLIGNTEVTVQVVINLHAIFCTFWVCLRMLDHLYYYSEERVRIAVSWLTGLPAIRLIQNRISSVRDAGGGGRSAACSARSPLLLVKSGKNCWCGGTGPGAPDQIIQLYQNYSVNLLRKMCNQVTIKLNSVHILQMVKITRWFLIPNSMNSKSVKIRKGVANQSQIKYQNTNNQLWL